MREEVPARHEAKNVPDGRKGCKETLFVDEIFLL